MYEIFCDINFSDWPKPSKYQTSIRMSGAPNKSGDQGERKKKVGLLVLAPEIIRG